MKADWLKTRQTKYSAYLAVYLLVIVGVLGAANWLANRHNRSFDTTANKRFSLSDQTIKVVRGLGSDVKITYFDQTSRFAAGRDLLDRYDNLSTKLQIEYVDPDKSPQIAKAAGVRTYGTIFVDSGGRKEEAKSLSEEEVTGALIRSLKTGERNACFVSGSGEHSLEQQDRNGLSNLKEALESGNYKTRTISLLGGGADAPPAAGAPPAAASALNPEVPKDCTVLIVAGPRYDYLEPVVKAIQSYIQAGGRALIMIDPPLSLGGQPNAGAPGLVKMLEGWGVVLKRDIALDTSGIGQIFGFSEVVPLVSSYETHPIVREMKGSATAFPLARTLEIKPADKVSAEKLFSTSANSYASANLNSPEIRINPARDQKGPLALAAAGTYDNKGRFVVAGSSGWVTNSIFRFNGNRDLVLNMMNWLSSDEDLISIRPKDPMDRRLTLSRNQMSRLFWSSVVLLPLLVVFSGMMVWWKRR
jgi:ABC-type uncharacterized transport system involved in gliding motility auxiliary subunit